MPKYSLEQFGGTFDSLFVMPSGAGGGAGVLGVPAELVVDGLPRLFRHAALVAAGLFHLLVEEVQVDWGGREEYILVHGSIFLTQKYSTIGY